MEATKQKGVVHAGKEKSLSSGNANENERRGWSEESYRRKNENPINNYDWSRHGLNFEIVDGKILPLGKQKRTLYERYNDVLSDVGFKAYKDGSTNSQNTYVELILSGSTQRMQELAFGDQKVSFERNPKEWQNWNVTRREEIEEFALDSYNFSCKQFGKDSIIGFEVHLDETEPHIHLNLVPIADKHQRGNVGGYIKIDQDGNPVRYTKGKHIGEVIKLSEGKYNALSDEKKKQYRRNERGTVRTISYAAYFGSTTKERSERMEELHTLYYENVGKKWGLERGDSWKELSEEERRQRRRKTKEEAYREKQAKEATQRAKEEQKETEKQTKTAKAEAEKWGKMMFDEKSEQFASLISLKLQESDFKTVLQETVNDLVELAKTPKSSILQSDKEWKKEQHEKAKKIVTRMNDRLFAANGIDKALKEEVLKLGKSLYADAKKEVADILLQNEKLLKENEKLQEEAKEGEERGAEKAVKETLAAAGLNFDKGEVTPERIGKAWRNKYDKAESADEDKKRAVNEEKEKNQKTITALRQLAYVNKEDGTRLKDKDGKYKTWQQYYKEQKSLWEAKQKELQTKFDEEKKEFQEEIADKINAANKLQEEIKLRDEKHQEHIDTIKDVIFSLMSLDMKEAVLIILKQIQKDMEDFVKDTAKSLERFVFGDERDIDSRKIFVSKNFVWARVLASIEEIPIKESNFNSLQADAIRIAEGRWQSWRDEKEELFDDAVESIVEMGNSGNQRHFNEDQANRIIRYYNHLETAKDFSKVTAELWEEAKPRINSWWRDVAAGAVDELDEAIEQQVEIRDTTGYKKW